MALLLATLMTVAQDDFPAEKLPPGWTLAGRSEITEGQRSALEKKLGGRIQSVAIVSFSMGGVAAEASVLRAATEDDALAIRRALIQVKSARVGKIVYELRTNEWADVRRLREGLGLVLWGGETAYDVSFRAACVDTLDYMEANEVGNLFLAGGAKAAERIAELTKDWKFGTSLRLWTGRASARAEFRYEPEPASREERDGTTAAMFTDPPREHGVPCVAVRATVRVKDCFAPVTEPAPQGLTKATARWPADAKAVRAIAAEIVKGVRADRERVTAIQAWVFEKIPYDGKVTGSRYGVEKVLDQRFGHCWDKSDVFVTLCRAAGIPARQVAGWLMTKSPSGHVWAEAYVDGGWLPVDPTAPIAGTTELYVPWFSTSDGEMPVVYVRWPQIRNAK